MSCFSEILKIFVKSVYMYMLKGMLKILSICGHLCKLKYLVQDIGYKEDLPSYKLNKNEYVICFTYVLSGYEFQHYRNNNSDKVLGNQRKFTTIAIFINISNKQMQHKVYRDTSMQN